MQEAKGNATIWFGHYPTSTIVAPHPGIRELMRLTLLGFFNLISFLIKYNFISLFLAFKK